MPTDPNEQTIKTLSGRWGASLAMLYAAAAVLLCVKAALIGSGALLNASLAVLLACTALCIGFLIGGRQAEIADSMNSDGFLRQAALLSAIDRHLAANDPQGQAGALIHLELSGTATIAATHGLKAEDKLISEAMARLMALLPAAAKGARAGRSSFLVFLPGEADPFQVAGLARSLTGNLAAGLTFDGAGLATACHAGIALCPKDGSTPEALMHSAELALAAATEQEEPGYGFYDPQLAAASLRQRDVQRAVATALASDSFRLVYQPLHNMRTGELVGFEALMRLEDSALGNVPPSEFIPAAEETGLITAIGDWALQEACRAAAHWPPHLVVAVNLSPAQLRAGTIVQAVRRALEAHGMPAYRLEVEITEGTLIEDSETVLNQLRILRDMGVGVALDDFGTGYSSLGYLWKFPFSKLKIDRSFVAALDQSSSAKGILRSVVKLGHGLGMTVTAEGIENRRQLLSLRNMGCDMAQGFLLGRPAETTDLAAIIMRNFAFELARAGRESLAAGVPRTS